MNPRAAQAREWRGAGTGQERGGPGTAICPRGQGRLGGGAMFWGHQPSGAAKDAAVAAAAAAATVYPTFPMFWPAAGAASRCRPIRPRRAKPWPWRRPWRRQRRRPRRLREVAAPEPLTAPSTKDGGPVGRGALPQRAVPRPLTRTARTRRCRPRWPRWPRRPPPARKGSYVSAFRPVVKDAESLLLLYGSACEAYGGGPAQAGGRAQGPAAAT